MHRLKCLNHYQRVGKLWLMCSVLQKPQCPPPFYLQSLIPAIAEPLLRLSFERIGRLKCKDGLNLQTSKVGWFALAGSTLHAYLSDSQGEEIHLRKLNELCECNTCTDTHKLYLILDAYCNWSTCRTEVLRVMTDIRVIWKWVITNPEVHTWCVFNLYWLKELLFRIN